MPASKSDQFLRAVRPTLRALGLAFGCFALTQVTASCGEDSPAGACVPGASQACLGPGACDGVQVCSETGDAFSACDCSSGEATGGSAGAGADGSTGGMAGAAMSMTSSTTMAMSTPDTGPPPLRGMVGRPCVSDAECPVGAGGETLECITPTDTGLFGVGGPQDGYCSLPCTAEGDECNALDDNSACVPVDDSGTGVCWALCNPGNAEGAVKCRGPAQACLPINNSPIGLCAPVCQGDAACGEGLFCHSDRVPALCEPEPTGEGPTGAACTPETAAEVCNGGRCAAFNPADLDGAEVAFCSANCTILVADSCGPVAEGSTVREATCLFPQFEGAGGGDIGSCLEICDTAADCEQEGYVCNPDGDVSNLENRTGICVPPEFIDDPGPPVEGELGDAGISADASTN